MRKLDTRVVEAESRHQQFIEQVEHGGMVRRKIEAQLLDSPRLCRRINAGKFLNGRPLGLADVDTDLLKVVSA